jgi:hypothetical protein
LAIFGDVAEGGCHGGGDKMRKLIITLVAFCPLSPAWAVNLGSAVDDVSVISIEVVDQLKRADRSFPIITRSKLVFMVKISTSINLVKEKIEWRYDIKNQIYVCDQGIFDETRQIWSDRHVYDDNNDIDFYHSDNTGRICDGLSMKIPYDNTGRICDSPSMKIPSNAKAGRYVYEIYFEVENKRDIDQSLGGPPYFKYDLQNEPRDMCFQIRGNNHWSFWSFTSNTVLIPKAQLIDAMSRAGLLKPKRR